MGVLRHGWSAVVHSAVGRALVGRVLPNPVREGYPDPTAAGVPESLRGALVAAGLRVEDLTVDRDAYARYVAAAGYAPGHYAGNFAEKTLEHHLAFQLLGLRPGDVYIDLANAGGPAPAIAARIHGTRSYRQDLAYPPGLHGRVLGGDAGRMPVPDGFAHGLSLHCAFEHFEGDADTRLVREAARVLAPGGRLCIVPLYLFTEHAALTDPASWGLAPPAFEREAVVYLARGYGNRHGRFYSVPALLRRVVAAKGDLDLTVYFVRGAAAVDPACYVRFAAVLAKPGG